MEIAILKLAVVFLIIVVLIWFKRPLYQSILGGTLVAVILYGFNFFQIGKQLWNVLSSWSSMSILVNFYLITFLQKMLEQRQQMKLAQQDLNGLFNNRRINASLAPLFIGLLPSAAATFLCADIVKESTDGYLDKKEQGFVASWFRHIPESTLPTYTGVLLMSNLSCVPIAPFMVGMVVPVVSMFALGYFLYLKKVPKETGVSVSTNRWMDFVSLLKHSWSLLLILLFILAFGLSVIVSISIVIIMGLIVYQFRWEELEPMFSRAFEGKLLLNTFLILVFKEVIEYTGVIGELPAFFSQFHIPLYMVFSLLFFFGGIVSGSSGIIALGTTMAFAAMPGGGVPLMVLLMCMCHAASLLSPTHVCLAVVSEAFGISMGSLIRKTLPAVGLFMIITLAYYQFLVHVLP